MAPLADDEGRHNCYVAKLNYNYFHFLSREVIITYGKSKQWVHLSVKHVQYIQC